MASITIDLSNQQFQQLQDLAKSHGIPMDVFLKAGLESWLNSQTSEFLESADDVLQKNVDLHQRVVSPENKRRLFAGPMTGKVDILGDIVSPIVDEEDWECLR